MTFYWRKSTVWPWERIFSQKVPENHLFWRQDFWITWLWRGLAPTILKIETFSACVSENLGHELSDEPWADLLASKLSDWQPFEIFFGAAMENCRKRRFLLFFVSTPKKFSNGCQSDNFDPRRSAHGSSESLCPKFSETHAEKVLIFKIVGASPLQSQVIQNRVRQLLTTVGNFWQLMGTFENFWQLLATLSNFWQLSATLGNSRHLLASLGKSRQLLTTFDNTIKLGKHHYKTLPEAQRTQALLL